VYEFYTAFHSKYGYILYRFRSLAFVKGGIDPVGISPIVQKPEWQAYQRVKKFEDMTVACD